MRRRAVLGLLAATLAAAAVAPLAFAGPGSKAMAREGTRAAVRDDARAAVPEGSLARPDRVRRGANLARVLFATRATAGPGRGRVVARPRPTTALGGAATQLRVVGQKVVRGRLFVRVLLPQRPNGARGWISDDAVVLLRSRWRVRIDRSARILAVTRDGRRVKRHRIVVGKPSSPTPRGEFAISEMLPQRPADGFLGRWVLPLTAYSGTYRQFEGGPGRVAIHGRAGASLRNPLGSAASHGCIRMSNRAVGWIAKHVPAGSAVIIR